jgi:flagellin
MAQVINTNVASLFAGAALNRSANALLTAQQRLSSGLRINSAKDDVTGMVNAAGFDKQIRGSNQAIRNANDGISKAQIADGYHQQVYENLMRLRELAVQDGGTIAAGNKEAAALVAEDTRILALITDQTTVVVNANGGTVTATGTKATLAATATDTVTNIDTDITSVTTARATYGADMVTFQSAINALGAQSVNASAAFSRIMDTDYAAETTNMTRNQILQQAGIASLAQSNQNPSMVLSLLR